LFLIRIVKNTRFGILLSQLFPIRKLIFCYQVFKFPASAIGGG
jgi:hypothetical protein